MSQILNNSLAQIAADVQDAVESQLEAARQPGGDIDDVDSLIIGDRARIGDVDGVTVWAVPSSHVPQRDSGHSATHDFGFRFVAMVNESDDPEAGRAAAMDLLFRVYDVVIAGHNLGDSTLVADVIPNVIDPAPTRAESNRNIFFASADFSIRVRRRE